MKMSESNVPHRTLIFRSIPQLIAVNDVIATKRLTGDQEAASAVNSALAKRGLDCDTIITQASSSKLNEVERINRMIASADARQKPLTFEPTSMVHTSNCKRRNSHRLFKRLNSRLRWSM
jgi:hypothetical protein